VYVHVSGPQNVADCLSRLLRIADNKTSHDKTEQYICLVSEGSTPVATTTREIERASSEDSDLDEVRKCLVTGDWNKITCKEYLPLKDELCATGY
jgi:hypothetical protein